MFAVSGPGPELCVAPLCLLDAKVKWRYTLTDSSEQQADRPANVAQWANAIQDAGMGKRSLAQSPLTIGELAVGEGEGTLVVTPAGPVTIPAAPEMANFVRQVRDDFTRMMMEYQFAIDEVLTKVTILREEYLHLQKYNPIEHVTSRVKTAESILNKMARRGVAPTVEAIRENIRDIAGIRITCSFIADTYKMMDALASQDDIQVLEVKDYIANPKPNGYKSLHAIVEIPVFLSTGPVRVPVEVQIRTIAMDFWASLEHKIFYKYEGDVPPHLIEELTDAAHAAENLDLKMERLHKEMHGDPNHPSADTASLPAINDETLRRLWESARNLQ